MDAKEYRIAYQVAWKAAIELMVGGIARPETTDLGAEVADLARMLYLPLAAELESVTNGGVAPTPAAAPAPGR